MRFIIVHKTNAHWEAGALPTRDLIDRVGKMIGELVKADALLGADGLRPSALGVRVRFSGSERSVTNGPFTDMNGEAAGFAILKVGSMDEAIECTARFAQVIGDVEVDIRPVTEPWDIGLGARPEGPTMLRVMAVHKMAQSSEAGQAPTPERMAEMGRLIATMKEAGVLLSTEGFPPTSQWARLKTSGGRRIVSDGPFTESKELIGGFVIVRASSRDEALEWLHRYADAVAAEEIDLIPLTGP